MGFVGTTRSSSVTVEAIPQDIDSKDENLVFVAGATGKVGSRTVRLSSTALHLYKVEGSRNVAAFFEIAEFHNVHQGAFEIRMQSSSWCPECSKSRISCEGMILISGDSD